MEDGTFDQPETDATIGLPPARDIEQQVRRSTRQVKLKNLLMYDQPGRPSYQPWRLGTKPMCGAIYPMPILPVTPEVSYYSHPVAWVY